MRVLICIAPVVSIFVSSLLQADGPFLRPLERSDRFDLLKSDEGLGELVNREGELGLYRPGPATRRLAAWLMDRSRTGDGGGGNVRDLVAVETNFSDELNGNVVLLIWTEETPNLTNIRVVQVEGDVETVLGTVDALGGADLPGANSIFVINVPEGPITFIVEGNGEPMRAETTINILAEQPFSDVENFTCAEGETNDLGNCDMIITWDTPPPLPGYHVILLGPVDGPPDYVIQTPGGATDRVAIGNLLPGLLPPGDYELTNLGFLETPENPENLYRGGAVETTCTLECTGDQCFPPANLSVCQSAYSAEAGNEVRMEWINRGSYVGVDVFLDDESSGTVLPDAQGEFPDFVALGGVSPGEHTIGIQAVCEGNEVADPVEATITIVDTTPHPNPVVDLSCEFIDGDPTAEPPVPDQTVATWTNADPSAFFDIYVVDANQNTFYLGAAPGDLETISVINTTPDVTLVLQFFSENANGSCYGSERLSCRPPPPGNIFIRGDCNGAGGVPQITSAVFGLNWLFGGGENPSPPCQAACDANADGPVNISDMVYILNFLFGGTAPPPGWIDANTPVCEVESVENCAAGLEVCPF